MILFIRDANDLIYKFIFRYFKNFIKYKTICLIDVIVHQPYERLLQVLLNANDTRLAMKRCNLILFFDLDYICHK